MQQLFEKFETKEQITDSDIPFSFTELNETYCKTDRKKYRIHGICDYTNFKKRFEFRYILCYLYRNVT
jgi:hypothetical protein